MSSARPMTPDETGTTILRPETEADIRDIVAAAVSAEEPLAIEGTGSKAGLGRPVPLAKDL